jgi:hypothetical protein
VKKDIHDAREAAKKAEEAACWRLVLKCYELRTRQHKRVNGYNPSSFEALYPLGYKDLQTKGMKDIPSTFQYILMKEEAYET